MRTRQSRSPEPAWLGAAPARERVVKVKAVDSLIETLRQDIVTGRMAKGERMPSERAIAERFGVSQPTVREALRALETLGLVAVHHGRGCYVSAHADYGLASALQTLLQLGQVDIMEVLTVRQALGRQSVSLAVLRATDDDILAMQAALDAIATIEEADDVNEVIKRIVDFQRALSAASDNPLLYSLELFLATLLIETQVRAFRRKGLSYWKKRSLSFQGDRHALFDAIRRREAKRAVAAMDRYLEHQRATFQADQAAKLSDPRLIAVAAAMLPQFKGPPAFVE